MKSFAVSTRRKFLVGTGATALATTLGGLALPAISRAAARTACNRVTSMRRAP